MPGKIKKPICECCRRATATIKDYRIEDEITSKYRVCKYCFNLSDEEFFEEMEKDV